jgi:hypothetical protein
MKPVVSMDVKTNQAQPAASVQLQQHPLQLPVYWRYRFHLAHNLHLFYTDVGRRNQHLCVSGFFDATVQQKYDVQAHMRFFDLAPPAGAANAVNGNAPLRQPPVACPKQLRMAMAIRPPSTGPSPAPQVVCKALLCYPTFYSARVTAHNQLKPCSLHVPVQTVRKAFRVLCNRPHC